MRIDGFPVIIADRYQLLEKLGTGGMGTVYAAVDCYTGRTVALKKVAAIPDLADSAVVDDTCQEWQQALTDEFKALAALKHPNIVRVFDFGMEDDLELGCKPYFTMELLANAQSIIAYGQYKPLKIQIDLLRQMLQALAYLHERGILHNDLKPENILIVNGQVKLLDFGLAGPIGRQRDASGTLAYMSPEVLRELPASAASDLYAVGVIAYEMLIGQHPFDTSNTITLIDDILQKSPDLSYLLSCAPLADILGSLLMKQPEDRYQSAAAVITDLEMVAA